jgi:predicted dithiol-disulfide oxidoreductase (DUF899 family)
MEHDGQQEPSIIRKNMPQTATGHKIVSREEWLAARTELLQAEKALTRQSDAIAKQRRELPWVRLEKNYQFDTDQGKASLAELFRGRSQLLVYHFMFGPDFKAGCPSCSSIADGFNGIANHLAHHDVMLWAISRAPLPKLQAFQQRMGWTFPWASSSGTDFNTDFQAAHTPEQEQAGSVEYNFRLMPKAPAQPAPEQPWMAQIASIAGTTWPKYKLDTPGISAFVLEDGVVYHTYSAYSRGLDGLWNMYQWLDRTPKGRNENDDIWLRLHDQYETTPPKSAASYCHSPELHK